MQDAVTGRGAGDEILVEAREGVRVVTLNRPDVYNAANEALHGEIARVWGELGADADVRAIVLTGSGGAFSAGGDLDLLDRMVGDLALRDRIMAEGLEIVQAMTSVRVPIVAAVNGPAVGLGCSLATMCDLVVIEEHAYFADPHVALGLVAADGGAITWPLLTSLLRAKEYILLGDRVPADAAVQLGLADRVVPKGTSLEVAIEIAERLAALPPQSVIETKAVLNRSLHAAVGTWLSDAIRAETASFDEPRFQENLAADAESQGLGLMPERGGDVVVVTGAARGMGRACVDRLRGEADQLVAVDLEPPDIDGTVGVACDVADPAAIARLVAQVGELGSFRALVHAAGISPTMADARQVFEVDLVGTQLLLDAFEPLVEAGSNAVCFASSSAYQMALMGPDAELDAFVEDPLAPGFLDGAAARFDDSGLAYGWAKRQGVIRAAARAAVSWGRRGGRVTSVSPGLIDTPMNKQEFEVHPIMQVMLDNTPLARLGRADEVAALVGFLVSDDASFISGIDILIDGGCLEALRGLAQSMGGETT